MITADYSNINKTLGYIVAIASILVEFTLLFLTIVRTS
jgi:hypothetical protein